MKRVSAIVSATAAVAFLMSGCGTETDGDNDTNESSTTANSTSNSAEPTRTPPATETENAPDPDEEETEIAPDEENAEPEEDTEPNGAQTTCNQFEALDDNAQRGLIEQILAENPQSSFAGSPHAALSTAKLVCNSEDVATEPVAVAAEILPR